MILEKSNTLSRGGGKYVGRKEDEQNGVRAGVSMGQRVTATSAL
jgi:hypothetical protein